MVDQIKSLGIVDVYDYVTSHNKSVRSYHSTYHLKSVCGMSIRGCEHFGLSIPYTSLIASASLFHDFNHIGAKNDNGNIVESIKGFLEFQNEYNRFEIEEESIIISLVRSTRYPYLSECNSLSLGEKIIRDSDVLQSIFCDDYMNTVVFALADELNIEREKMIDVQINFLKECKFCTEWASDKFSQKVPEMINMLENYTPNLQ